MSNGKPYVPPEYSARTAMPIEGAGGFVNQADQLLKDLFGGDPEQLRAALKAQQDVNQGIKEACARVAATPDGQAMLEWLCDATLRRPTFLALVDLDPMRCFAHGVFREGQNAVVFLLLKAIAEGRQEPPPQREGA